MVFIDETSVTRTHSRARRGERLIDTSRWLADLNVPGDAAPRRISLSCVINGQIKGRWVSSPCRAADRTSLTPAKL